MKNKLSKIFITLLTLIALVIPVNNVAYGISWLYESYYTGDDSTNFFFGATWAAQSFTTNSSGHTIDYARLKMTRFGAPAGNVTVSIRAADVNGKPTGADLDSYSFAASSLAVSPATTDKTITFSSSPIITGTTNYTVVVRLAGGDGANNVGWRRDTSTGFTSGARIADSADSGVTWGAVSATDDYMFEIYGTGLPLPLVTTNPTVQDANGVWLLGYVEDNTSNVTAYGFQIGSAAGVYDWEHLDAAGWTEFQSASSFGFQSDNFTVGNTYYIRAKVTSNHGTGYGEEISFVYNPPAMVVITGEVSTQRSTGGMYYAAFIGSSDPNVADNMTAHLGTESGNWTLDALWVNSSYEGDNGAGQGMYMFSTNGFTLSDNTTYYYMAEGFKDSVSYNGTIKSFTTQMPVFETEKPSILISEIKDVTRDQFTITVKVINDYGLPIINKGVRLSSSYMTDPDLLLPEIYNFPSVKPLNTVDNTFTLTISGLSQLLPGVQNATFAVIAYATNYNGEGASDLQLVEAFTADPNDPFQPTEPVEISEILDDWLARYGLSGTMARWLLLAALIIIECAVFGTCIVKVKDDGNETLAKILGFILLLVVVATVAGFIFSGYLGIWPVVMAAATTVCLVLIIVGRIFSGNTGEA